MAFRHLFGRFSCHVSTPVSANWKAPLSPCPSSWVSCTEHGKTLLVREKCFMLEMTLTNKKMRPDFGDVCLHTLPTSLGYYVTSKQIENMHMTLVHVAHSWPQSGFGANCALPLELQPFHSRPQKLLTILDSLLSSLTPSQAEPRYPRSHGPDLSSMKAQRNMRQYLKC